MAAFCQHCGFNLTPDEPVEIGHWAIGLDGVYYDGMLLALTRSEVSALHTLARQELGREPGWVCVTARSPGTWKAINQNRRLTCTLT
jgi:hypothetical protein